MTTALRAAWHYLPAALFLAALIVVWDVWVRVAGTPSYLMPPPGSLLDAFLDQRAVLPGHIRTTLSEALLGLAFAALLGVGAAALIASLPLARRVLLPAAGGQPETSRCWCSRRCSPSGSASASPRRS